MFAFQKQFHSLLHLQKGSHTISLLTKPEAEDLTQRAKHSGLPFYILKVTKPNHLVSDTIL